MSTFAPLVRRPAPSALQSTPSTRRSGLSTPRTWPEFLAFMAATVGTTDVHVGTFAEQDAREGPGIPAQSWRSGDPGRTSDFYGLIAEAIRDFSDTFGGAPDVRRVIFFARHYTKDPTTGAVLTDDRAASFGAGELVIYTDVVLSKRMVLPMPGGGVDQPTRAESVHRVVSHELGHGIGETFHDHVDSTLFDRWEKEIGWVGHKRLYDIDQPIVQRALAAGQEPPKERMVGIQPYPLLIEKGSWDSILFRERPMSAYSLDGPGEDFAESVMAFVEAPAVLKARSPRRFAFIQSVQSRIVPFLNVLPRKAQPGDFPMPHGRTRVA